MKKKHVPILCNHVFRRLLFVIALAIPALVQAQYFEGFEVGQNNKGLIGASCSGSGIETCDNLDLSGVNWTLTGDFSGFDGNDYAGVVDLFGFHFFRINDTENEICWTSPVLDMSEAVAPIVFGCLVSETGNLESSDYIKMEYSIDGGPFVTADSRSGNFGALAQGIGGIIPAGSGNKLVLRLCAKTDSDSENIYFDDVTILNPNVHVDDCATDEESPEAICQNVTVQLDEEGDAEIAAEAVDNGSTDNCEIAGLELSQSGFSCEDVGEVTVTLTVTDANENSSTCTGTVTVEDNAAPSAQCQNVTVQLDENGEGTTTAEDVDNESSDACGIASIELSQTEFGCEEVGAVTVTLTVTDMNENSSTCTATVSVQDNIDPGITCNNFTVTFNGEYGIELDPDDLATASDNCSVVALESDPDHINCYEVGNVVPVTVTAYDPSENSSSCTSYVTVEGLPCGWMQMPNGIACTEGNEADYDVPSETFSLTASGCYTPSATNDESGFIKFSLCGDGSITARIASLTLPAYAGIVMRESDAAGAKKVAMTYQGAGSIGRYVRYTTNGASYPSYIPAAPGTTWLRIVRTGNTFQGYRSSNGITWLYSFTVNVNMAECIQIGLIAWGTNSLATITATFDHVVIDPPYSQQNGRPATGAGVNPQTETLEAAAIWPNPAAGEATLSLDAAWGEHVTVTVMDELGRQVKTIRPDSSDGPQLNLDLNGEAPGLYFVRIRNEEGRQTTLRLILTRP